MSYIMRKFAYNLLVIGGLISVIVLAGAIFFGLLMAYVAISSYLITTLGIGFGIGFSLIILIVFFAIFMTLDDLDV